MNAHGIAAIYRFEMARWGRTLWQSLITPVITTSLYFVVFGSALGSRMTAMEGVSYGAFIVPGLNIPINIPVQTNFATFQRAKNKRVPHPSRSCDGWECTHSPSQLLPLRPRWD